MTNLSAAVSTKGLAKNKVLVMLGILGAILLSILAFGILTSPGENKVDTDDNLLIYQDGSKGTDQLIQDILVKKQTASSVIAASAAIKSAIKFVASSVAIPAVSDMVPPLSMLKKNEPTPEELAQTDYTKKQLSSKYGSLSAKSLVFSNAPSKTVSNTSVTLVNSLPKTASGINTQQAIAGDVTRESVINITNDKQKQFMQDSKSANAGYLSSSLMDARSPYEVKAGSIIPATMINGLNSDLPGQVIAQVRENVYDSSTRRYLLIPQGAKLLGLYDNNITYGQERILVAWNRLIYSDGSSINLKAMPGTDLEGYAGFYDQVDNKYMKVFGASFIMGVITGAMQYSQNSTNANVQVGGIGVTTNTNPTVAQTLSGSLGQQLGQTGLAITQKNLTVQPTLIVAPNYPFNIMLTADMILRPPGRK